MNRLSHCSLIALFALLWTGCAEPTNTSTPSADTSTTGQEANTNSSATSASDSTTSVTAANQTAGGAAATSQQATAQTPSPDTSTATQPATTELVPAEAGVGQKGRSLDKYQDDPVQKIISQPAREFFRLRERTVFEIQIPQAMNLYKAEHGEAPKSHEQFMTDIIEANQITLPELRPGDRYIYDPQTEELMVERKVAQ